jgi:hypothetical protein
MTDDPTGDEPTASEPTAEEPTAAEPTAAEPTTGELAEDVPPPLTSEQRLRALTNDRKRKVRGKAKPAPGPATTHPGDLVDAVRERGRDTGRDQPI